jgi:2,4-diaminopentanoate dehydrogenase
MSYKVIQWATGSMGKTCLRAIIDHPDLELAGLFVYSDRKVGLDAGDIAHREKTGVIACNNIEDILELDADVVFHTAQIQAPYTHHNQDICRLLASGKNVISINGHSYPQYWGKEYTQTFLNACEQGCSTLLGSGLNPGFITDKIATIAAGVCLEIEHIEVTEVVECNIMQNPNYVFGMLGFGSPCEDLNPNDPEWEPAEILNGMYAEVVAHLVERLGHQLERVETDHVMYPATQDIDMAAGLIKKGTVSHTHWRWHGIVNGRRLVTQSIHWIMETAHLDKPDYTIWSVNIRGLPSLDITIDMGVPEEHPFKTTAEQYGVAGSLINSVPSLVAAPPGIREIPLAEPALSR